MSLMATYLCLWRKLRNYLKKLKFLLIKDTAAGERGHFEKVKPDFMELRKTADYLILGAIALNLKHSIKILQA